MFSNVGLTALNTVKGEISVQNMTAEDGLKSRQGGSSCNWMNLRACQPKFFFALSDITKAVFKNMLL